MRRRSGEEVAGCDVVVSVDMIDFLSCQQCLELLCDERCRLLFHPGLLREYPVNCHFSVPEASIRFTASSGSAKSRTLINTPCSAASSTRGPRSTVLSSPS